jgi:arginine decarboxylase
MATNGNQLLENALQLARQARNEINNIKGLYAFGKELIGSYGCNDFDETKLGVNIRGLGLSGYKMEALLRKEYNIQVEMSDVYNILAMISIGDRKEDLDALVHALSEIAANCENIEIKSGTKIPFNPEMIVSPRDAFYSPKKLVSIENAIGEIAGEMIMAYPPGIPVICLGERITKDIVDYIMLLKEEKCHLQGTSDPYVNHIRVLGT